MVCVWLTELGLSKKLTVHWERAAKFVCKTVYVLLSCFAELLCRPSMGVSDASVSRVSKVAR